MSTHRIGLALGGGGARGLAHIHVIRALEQLGLAPTRIAGTSIGSIMGAAYAAGMTASDIETFVISTFSNKAEVLSRFWSMRPSSVSEVFTGPRTMIGNIDAKKAVKAFLPAEIPSTFEELSTSLLVATTDFYGQQEVIISSGDLYEAIAASAALPAIFRPIHRNGKVLVDGGIVNAVPFDLLTGQVDMVIAVDVVGGPSKSKREFPSRVEAIAGASQLMMQATTKMKCRLHAPDVMITPPVSGIGVLDFLNAKSIIKETVSTVETSKRAIEAAFETSRSIAV